LNKPRYNDGELAAFVVFFIIMMGWDVTLLGFSIYMITRKITPEEERLIVINV